MAKNKITCWFCNQWLTFLSKEVIQSLPWPPWRINGRLYKTWVDLPSDVGHRKVNLISYWWPLVTATVHHHWIEYSSSGHFLLSSKNTVFLIKQWCDQTEMSFISFPVRIHWSDTYPFKTGFHSWSHIQPTKGRTLTHDFWKLEKHKHQ